MVDSHSIEAIGKKMQTEKNMQCFQLSHKQKSALL